MSYNIGQVVLDDGRVERTTAFDDKDEAENAFRTTRHRYAGVCELEFRPPRPFGAVPLWILKSRPRRKVPQVVAR